jgi:hypothetical protein
VLLVRNNADDADEEIAFEAPLLASPMASLLSSNNAADDDEAAFEAALLALPMPVSTLPMSVSLNDATTMATQNKS